jgi:hypothetical protein
MALTEKKYTEPSRVLAALIDDFGQPVVLGDQKDIGEFSLNFLERIEEGLGERPANAKERQKGEDEEPDESSQEMSFMEKIQAE